MCIAHQPRSSKETRIGCAERRGKAPRAKVDCNAAVRTSTGVFYAPLESSMRIPANKMQIRWLTAFEAGPSSKSANRRLLSSLASHFLSCLLISLQLQGMPDSSLGLPTSATDGDTRPQPIASTSQAAAAALSASGTRATGDEEQSKSKKGSKKGPRAAGGEAGEDGEPAKKRKRVSYSCTACAQRKAKVSRNFSSGVHRDLTHLPLQCDRGRPCNTCSARGVGATCRYLVDG